MSTPKYFSYFPDIDYAFKANKAGQVQTRKIKDYFNLLTVRDDIFREETLYSPYEIKDGERPDEVSYKFYEDEQFYWIILQINNIVDYYNEWPLSQNELTEFVLKKYGGYPGAESIKQYETIETFDEASPANLVLPGGLVVPENFIFRYPATPGSDVILSSRPIGVTNYTYERVLNDKKSQIYILDRKYIWDYVREVRKYARNLEPLASFVDISTVAPSY